MRTATGATAVVTGQTGARDAAARLLGALAARRACAEPAVLIVAAHPDDEVIGAGAQLPLLPGVRLLHVTDGAPRNGVDAAAAGFDGWQAYARARRQEGLRALALAGVDSNRAASLDIADQAASSDLAGLAQAAAARFAALRPGVVITHAYEGGHPDHDATAFAVHAACALLARSGALPPALVEMTSYHADGAGVRTGEFLPDGCTEVTSIALDPDEQAFKQRLFACFATQRAVLASFAVAVERFRPAPAYDFTQPPHAGQLHYERHDWGMEGPRWRRLAAAALAALGLDGEL